jgi:hypothetical protein
VSRLSTGRCARSWSAAATAPVLTAVAGVLLLASSTPAHADPVPYTDVRSTGHLTLCDPSGRAVTSGSLSTRPLTHLVVAQTPAPTGYTTATLYGYQPRQGLDPGQWSGELLTGASRFGDARHPAVAALPEDLSLADFVRDFPATWSGHVQLRVYLGGPGVALQNQRYDTADLRVTDQRWSLVGGGGGSCGGVKAVPVAQLLGVQATAVPSPATSAAPHHAGTGSPSAAATASTAPQTAEQLRSASSAKTSSSSPSHLPAYVLTGVLLAALLVAARTFLHSRAHSPKGTR